MIRNLHLIVGSILLGVVGQLSFKEAANCIVNTAISLSLVWHMFVNPFVWIAFLSYGFSTILWITVLSRIKLSVAEPMLSMGFVLVIIFSHLFFGENISSNQWIGIVAISVGIMLVGERS